MFVFDACPECENKFTQGASVVKLNCRQSGLQAVPGPEHQAATSRRWGLWPHRGDQRNTAQLAGVEETWQVLPWSPQTRETFHHQLCLQCTESMVDGGPATCPICGASHASLSKRRLAAEIARLKKHGGPSLAQRVRAYRLGFTSAAAQAGEVCLQSVLFPALKASACVTAAVCCIPAVFLGMHRRAYCSTTPDLDQRGQAVAMDVILVAIAGIAIIALCV